MADLWGEFDQQQTRPKAAKPQADALWAEFDEPADAYDFAAVERATAATPNLGDLITDAPAVVAMPQERIDAGFNFLLGDIDPPDYAPSATAKLLTPSAAPLTAGDVQREYTKRRQSGLSRFADTNITTDEMLYRLRSDDAERQPQAPDVERGDVSDFAVRQMMRVPEIGADLLELPHTISDAVYGERGNEGSSTRRLIDDLRRPGKEMDAAGFGLPGTDAADATAALKGLTGFDTGRPVFAEQPSNWQELFTVMKASPWLVSQSALDMLMAMGAPAPYVAALTNDAANERARNDGRDVANLGDIAMGAGGSILQVGSERLATGRLGAAIPAAGSTGQALARIGREGAIQIGTENFEELADLTARQAGTDKGISSDEVLETMVGATLAGAPLTGVQAGKEALALRNRNAVAPTSPEVAAELRGANAPQATPAPVLDTARIAAMLGDLAADPASAAPAPAAAAPEADTDLAAMLANSLPPEQLAAVRIALGDLISPAPSPASPATEPSPAPAAAQSSPVRPDTPLTREQAEPVAQIQTTGQPVQAPAAQSAPVTAGADLGDAFIDENGQRVEREGRTPEPAPRRADRGQVLSMRSEIGWSSRGGELVREAADASAMNEDERLGLVAQPKGAVVGRTSWIGQPSPMGGESAFWRDRPSKWTEQQANAAFDAFEAGQPLTKQQQRIIDHAQSVADTYAQAEAEQAAELAAYDEVAQQREFAGLREDIGEAMAQADRTQALTYYQLITRAVQAGHSIDALDALPGESSQAYHARLWNLPERTRGPDAAAAGKDQAAGDQGRAGRNVAAAEALGDFALESEPAAAEPARTQEVRPSQGAGLFGAPSPRDFIDAAQRSRDDARNGKAGTGRTDIAAGDGELFADKRPEQARVDEEPKPQNVKLRNFGWDAVKLSEHSYEELNELRAGVEEKHANPKGADGGPVENGRSTIYLYDREGRRKLDALAWAVTYKQQASRADREDAARKIAANAPPPNPPAYTRPTPLPAVAPAPTFAEPAKPVQMTMAEWKATHKNSKGIIDGQRTIMRGGRIVPVEIIKPTPTPQSEPDGLDSVAEAYGSDEWHALVDDALQESGQPVVDGIDAERRWDRGERIFALHENADTVSEVTGVDMLKSYTPDQLLALPRSVAEQYGIAEREAAEPDELSDDGLTDAERASFERQSRGSDHVAKLRAAVDAALGSVASKVHYVADHKSLPERLRNGVESRLKQRGGSGQTTALFDPKTGDVYLFTNANPSPERAVFNVAHEIAGHQGLRALLGDKLNSALDLALQNPTVAAVSEAIALERNIDASTDAGQRLAAEEALAELAAAVRTGNYDLIQERYGVNVPAGIRSRVQAAVENFLRRLKALLSKTFGQEFTDEDVRSLLENAWQAAQGEVETSDAAELESVDIPDTGRRVIAEGRLLSVIDAAKAAGLDLSDLTAAHASNSASEFVQALDALLPQLNPKPQRTTGTKNAVTDAEREAAGRHPILRDAVQTNEQTLIKAMRELRDDPSAGQVVAARLAREGVERISVADEALLLVHKTELMNQREAAAKKLADANTSESAKDVARQQWAEAEAQITQLDQAAVNSGREWGRLGQFRQRMLREDFTLVALERKERARLERPLTSEESATVKAMADTIAELQRKVDALQTRVGNAESEGAYADLVKQLARPAKSRPTLESLRKAANDARARLAAAPDVPSRNRQSGAVISPSLFADYAVIGAYHIANGAAKLADWVGAMRADLGERFDDFKRDHPNIFKAAQQQLDKPLKADATVAEVMERIDLANITPKDVRKLIEALVGEGMRGEPAVIAAAAEHLDLAADEVRTLFVQASPKAAPTLTEAQEELRDLRKIVRLQLEIERLEAGASKPPRTPSAPDSPAVAAKKQELAEVRERLKPPRDREGRYQELRGKQIAKRIQELQGRIAAGDFAPRPRVPRALNAANEAAAFELHKAKVAFLEMQLKDELSKRSRAMKALGLVGDSLNLSRAIRTSFDMSALLRQGGFIAFGRKRMAAKAFGRSLRVLLSEKNLHAMKERLGKRANAALYAKAGLELTGLGAGPLSLVEEAYASRWLDRIGYEDGQPLRNAARFVTNAALSPVRASGRNYVALLNEIRADAFDTLTATLSRTGKPTLAEAQDIARYINTATGRGKIGKDANAGAFLNATVFAPRLVASRFQLLAGAPVWMASTPRMKRLIAGEYARFLIGVSMAAALAAFTLGDDDEPGTIGLDVRSPDFGKIKIGNTTLDPLVGLGQVVTLLGRMATGETVSGGFKFDVTNGKLAHGGAAPKPLRPYGTLTDFRRFLGEDLPAHKMGKDGSLPFLNRDAAAVIGQFGRTKLSPVAGDAVSALSGADPVGKPVTAQGLALAQLTPMSFSNVLDIVEAHGTPRGTGMVLLGLLGMSVQHRTQTAADQFADFTAGFDAVKTDVKDRLAALPPEQWPQALEDMKAKYGPLMEGVELKVYKADGKYGDAGDPMRDEDGKPKLEFNRLADEDRYRGNFKAAGGDDEGRQIHHLIPDNLVRRHPLMAHARSLGYDLDEASNLIGLADGKAKTGELGHTTAHPDYDAQVYAELQAAQKALKDEHGSLEAAPKDEVMEAVRKVEAKMRQRIERRDVPIKDNRLARLSDEDEPAV